MNRTVKRLSATAHGGEPERKSGLAFAGVALDYGELALWYIGVPQPSYLLEFDFGHTDKTWFGLLLGH